LVGALLDYAEVLHHVGFCHASGAEHVAESVLITVDLIEDTLDSLLKLRNRLGSLERLGLVLLGARFFIGVRGADFQIQVISSEVSLGLHKTREGGLEGRR
jgi:hypothetical protein